MFGAFKKFGRMGSGASAWSERALWPLGAASPGMRIDGPSYPAACYQDSAGTTALSTVGAVLDSSNPIGLMLDRKDGLELGPELLDTSFDPKIYDNGGTSGGYTGLTGSFSNASQGLSYVPRFSFDILDESNKRYKVSGVISGVNRLYNITTTTATANPGGGAEFLPSTNGYFEAVVTSLTGEFCIWTNGTSIWNDLVIAGLSVREITGLHLSQSTSPARPVASGRKNLLIGTATLSTQSVTVAAIPHTITFSGGGTVTASGTYTGALTSGQTFTPTAGTLTLTVAGSVTSAQLERGSAATSYQAVVSDSSYTATGFPQFAKFDGTDDGWTTGTKYAGTIGSNAMECLIAIRRDSSAAMVCGLYESAGHATKVFGIAESGSSSPCVGADAGSGVTVWVDNVQLAGGTAVTRNTLHAALTPGVPHILEFRGLDQSAWTAAEFGKYTGYIFNGAVYKIHAFAAGQDANRERDKRKMAAEWGVTLS